MTPALDRFETMCRAARNRKDPIPDKKPSRKKPPKMMDAWRHPKGGIIRADKGPYNYTFYRVFSGKIRTKLPSLGNRVPGWDPERHKGEFFKTRNVPRWWPTYEAAKAALGDYAKEMGWKAVRVPARRGGPH